MAIGHRKRESGDVAQFIAAGAYLASISPFGQDTTGGQRYVQNDATGSQSLFHVFVPAQPATIHSPISQAIEQIQRTFSLTQDQLASACDVSRAMVHRWKHGASPRKGAQIRLSQLREAALNWQKEGYPDPNASHHLPLVQGKSLLDLLHAKPLDIEAILFAGNRLKLMALGESTETLPDPFK
jgi:DNA-binding transcriptional regulator YiaG